MVAVNRVGRRVSLSCGAGYALNAAIIAIVAVISIRISLRGAGDYTALCSRRLGSGPPGPDRAGSSRIAGSQSDSSAAPQLIVRFSIEFRNGGPGGRLQEGLARVQQR